MPHPLHIALCFPRINRRGGVERIALEAANFLVGRGHRVTLICVECDRAALHPAIEIAWVKSPLRPPALRLWAFARRSRRVMKTVEGVDCVASFGAMSPRGVYWVQSVHAAWLDVSGKKRRGWARLKQKLNPMHPVALRFERRTFGTRHYDKLVALTPEVRDDLARFYGVPERDVVIVPNGFSPEEFNPARAARERARVRAELDLPTKARVVAFVANETARKGFGPLLRAVARLDDESVHLLAVGRLNMNGFEREIESLGLKGRVHSVGPTNEVARYFAAADCFALPTQYEAWGLVIVEALACGLPVLTSRLAGAAIAVEEGRTGFLLEDPDDEAEIAARLRELLHDWPVSPQEIADSVECFRWDQVLLEYEGVLQDAAHARRKKSGPRGFFGVRGADIGTLEGALPREKSALSVLFGARK